MSDWLSNSNELLRPRGQYRAEGEVEAQMGCILGRLFAELFK